MSGGDSFDDLLSTLGFGRWQLPSLMVTVLAMSQFSVHLIGSPLLSAPLAFRCSILPLSLRWGRRRAVVGACAVNLVVVLAMALTPLYPLLITLRFVAGCSVMAMLVPAWSLTLESTPAGCRSRVGMLLGLPFSASTVLLAVVGCFIREWRILLLVCSSPILILLPVAFMTDESPRWLVQQARMEEATRVMHKALQQNKVQLTAPLNTLMEQLIQESKATSSGASHGSSLLLSAVRQVWSYLRAPAMRTIIIVTPILWFLQSCLYLGVLINANNFTSTDPFLYLALSGLMEAVAIVVITPLTGYLGRRVMVWAGLALGGALLMLELLVPEDSGYFWVDWLLVMLGFLLVAGAFQVNYVYAPELFPTETRARGFAFVNVMGSVGFSCAPLITYVLAEYAWWAVSVTFGCAGILGSLLVPFLPETNKRPLPETLQDVENRQCKFLFSRRKRSQRQRQETADCHTNMTPLLEAATSGLNTPESPHCQKDQQQVQSTDNVGIEHTPGNGNANNSVL
ncbi:solute carrier family 22 member 15-like isoform X3 [Homarus americanus]|uniref:solute carrier family 22 member 15-like isoform X3 n=1 Tax=Homarus americanus TaxID=6706 RepID=UPI001C4581CA|nr:solute carrier family 22 member 15-like isoform X3 [Homarus americanus]